jgi:hypothetical protein
MGRPPAAQRRVALAGSLAREEGGFADCHVGRLRGSRGVSESSTGGAHVRGGRRGGSRALHMGPMCQSRVGGRR